MSDQFNIQPGTVFAGDFRIVRSLNAGGMGAVYAAEQISTGKPRAVKVMLSQLIADPSLRKRFEQEARIASLIESEHIVEVVGAGVDGPSGLPWLAMELLSGEDLSELVTHKGPLSVPDVLAIFEQLCHAVGAAHRVGVVHRDLKPENIFLAQAHRAGASFMVKVLDFGIAKIVAEASTRQTAAIGSPIWMAPEQADQRPIAPSTDVWPLGLIAFYLLTGRSFWKSANDEQATMPQVLKEVLFEPIVPASLRSAELGRPLPPAFDAWFARCVAREPASRFPDATQAGLALVAALSGNGAVAYAATSAVPLPGSGSGPVPSQFAPTPSGLHPRGTAPPLTPPAYGAPGGTAPAGQGSNPAGGFGGTGGAGVAASYTIGAPPVAALQTGVAPPPPAVPKGLVAFVVLGALFVGTLVAGGIYWMARSTHGTVAVVARPSDSSASTPVGQDPKRPDDAKPDAAASTAPPPASAVTTNDSPPSHDSRRLAYTMQKTPAPATPATPGTPATTVVTPTPATTPGVPAPPPAVQPPAPTKTAAELAASANSSDWWTARRMLEPKVLAGTATIDELHLLGQICGRQHDKQCQRTVKAALAGKH